MAARPAARSAETPTPERFSHRAWLQPVLVAMTIALVFIGLYVGFARDPVPHHIPIAVAGPGLAGQVADALGSAVYVTEVGDATAGARLVSAGDVVAALDATGGGLRLAVASASGPTTVTALEHAVTGFAASSHRTISVTELVPLSAYDSRGMAGFYVAFGVSLASFSLAQNLLNAARRLRLRHRIAVTTGFTVLVGTAAGLLAGPVFGALPAPILPLALTLALLSAAAAFATLALGAWFGSIGIPLSTLLFVTVGNSTSGGVIGQNLLPALAEAVSAVLPQGAAVRALRDLSYFHGAHVITPLLTLAGWAVAGALLVHVRERMRAGADAPAGVGSVIGRIVPAIPALAAVVVTDRAGEVVGRAAVRPDGGFEVPGLPVGPGTVTVLADGYVPQATPVDVPARGSAETEFALRSAIRPRNVARYAVGDTPTARVKCARSQDAVPRPVRAAIHSTV